MADLESYSLPLVSRGRYEFERELLGTTEMREGLFSEGKTVLQAKKRNRSHAVVTEAIAFIVHYGVKITVLEKICLFCIAAHILCKEMYKE